MTCEDVQDMIPAYVTGSISVEQGNVVEQHVTSCLVCSLWLEEVRDLERVWHQPGHPLPSVPFVNEVMQKIGVDVAPVPRIEPDTEGRIEQRIARSGTRSRPFWFNTTLMHYGIAASCAVVLFQLGVFQGLGFNAEVLNVVVGAKVQGFFAYASQLLS